MDDRALFANWNIAFKSKCPEVDIAGSPNRSVARFVFTDEIGKRYIAEKFSYNKKNKQIRQNIYLEYIAGSGFDAVKPWLRTADDEHGVDADDGFWQIRPFVDADPLPRQTLAFEESYRQAWKSSLLKLKALSDREDAPEPPNARFFFSLYVPTLIDFIHGKMADIAHELIDLMPEFDRFFTAEADLPTALAHGDFHPGNILLDHGKLSAVIDWEFLGRKVAGYDLALLTGCLGMDDPAWLVNGAAATLRSELKSSDYLPAEAAQYFPDLIAATRLGWLGEWVDLNDHEMAEREIYFLKLLFFNRKNLVF